MSDTVQEFRERERKWKSWSSLRGITYVVEITEAERDALLAHIDKLEAEIVGYAEALASSKEANGKKTKRLNVARYERNKLEAENQRLRDRVDGLEEELETRLIEEGKFNIMAIWESLKNEHPEVVGMRVFPNGDAWRIEGIDATEALEADDE